MEAACRKCPSLRTAHLVFCETGGEVEEIKAHFPLIGSLWEV